MATIDNLVKDFLAQKKIAVVKGAACYPDLKSIPEKVDAVFILANPKVTEQIVDQCVELGVKHVWMYEAIPGSCPNQFLKPDFGHAMMRGTSKLFGFMGVNKWQS